MCMWVILKAVSFTRFDNKLRISLLPNLYKRGLIGSQKGFWIWWTFSFFNSHQIRTRVIVIQQRIPNFFSYEFLQTHSYWLNNSWNRIWNLLSDPVNRKYFSILTNSASWIVNQIPNFFSYEFLQTNGFWNSFSDLVNKLSFLKFLPNQHEGHRESCLVRDFPTFFLHDADVKPGP